MDRNSIESALTTLEQLNAVRLHKIGSDYYQMYCPFHSNGQERKPSFGVLLNDQYRNGSMTYAGFAHCFACGYAKNFNDFVIDACKQKNIAPTMHSSLKSVILDNPKDTDTLIPPELLTSMVDTYAANSLRLQLMNRTNYISEEELASYRYTVPYMYERKLNDAIIEKYDVGFDPNHIPPGRSKPLPCVTFPVRDISGNTLFICRRSIEGKYFNLPEGVEKPVYGLYELPNDCKSVIVCESIFNALTAVSYGYNAVALLGTGNSFQISQLMKLGALEFIICLDPDDAGKRGTAKLKKALSSIALVWTMQLPEGEDVNSCSREVFEACYAAKE